MLRVAIGAVLAIGLVLTVAGTAAAQPQLRRAPAEPVDAVDPPNVLLVVIDDMGYDLFEASCTPTLDSLSDRGLTLANFYANPVCSPTRACLLTGLYSFRTGVGTQVNHQPYGLDLGAVTLPERLPPLYATYAVGKWHLLPETLPDCLIHPNLQGFEDFAGSPNSLNSPESYSNWDLVENGVVTPQTGYATTVLTDLALERLGAPRPWLLYLAHHAPHKPYHQPPLGLLSCSEPPFPTNGRARARLMVEALDTELGRLLGAVSPDTFVFVVSDNGSPSTIAPDPFRAKGTVYQGGVHVPAWVVGPGVPTATITAPVSAVDIAATIAELAGVPFRGDGVSIAPYLRGHFKPVRSYAYVEVFTPNQPPGVLAPDNWDRAVIRADGWKLIRSTSGPDELYHLPSDPNEHVPLMDPDRHAELAAVLDDLGVD